MCRRRTVADISVETLAEIAKHAEDRRRSRTRPATSAGSRRSGSPAARISSSYRATTTWRSASTRWAGSAASRSPPMSRRGFARTSRRRLREGDWDDALKLQDRLYPLHAALFTDASPGPAKYALSRVRTGFPTELRLPLVEASDASKARGRRALDARRPRSKPHGQAASRTRSTSRRSSPRTGARASTISSRSGSRPESSSPAPK